MPVSQHRRKTPVTLLAVSIGLALQMSAAAHAQEAAQTTGSGQAAPAQQSVDTLDTVSVTGYRHEFYRVWTKLNRFRSAPPLEDILQNPEAGQLQIFHQVLKGELDSPTDAFDLMLGSNDRRFFSEGVQALATWRPRIWELTQTIELGARFPRDGIERLHTEEAFAMQERRLVSREQPVARRDESEEFLPEFPAGDDRVERKHHERINQPQARQLIALESPVLRLPKAVAHADAFSHCMKQARHSRTA
jgi:hypothetical protein